MPRPHGTPGRRHPISPFELSMPAARKAAGTVPSAPVVGRSRLQASCERVIAGQCPVCHWNLAPAGHAELLAQDIRMRLCRARGNAEALADLFVRAPRGDQLDDLELPLGN